MTIDRKAVKIAVDQKTGKEKVLQFLHAMATRQARANLDSSKGLQYEGDRDLYGALGWIKNPDFDDFYAKWRREGIGKRVITAYPEATWRGKPSIRTGNVAFDLSWKKLIKQHKLWHYFARADKLSGIGEYGVLFLGCSGDPKTTLKGRGKAKLLYLKPLHQKDAEITECVTSTSSERFGLPLYYSLTIADGVKIKVHWSRVIHIAEGLEEDDIYGTPRLEEVLNYINGLQLVTGGAPEMFWRGAFPGMGFMAQEGSTFDPENEDDLVDEIEEYMHDFKRYLKLDGVDVKEFSPQVVSPLNHFKMLMTAISGSKKIPQRILLGSEEGKLASIQDENNWANRVEERRLEFAEPIILCAFIDRCMDFGILPYVDEYEIEWPPPAALTETARADIAEKKSNAIKSYGTTPGAEFILPPKYFRRDVLGYSESEAELIEKEVQTELGDEEAEMKKIEKEMASNTEVTP